jgi:hypothetical protein
MALTSYTDLQTTIGRYLGRSDLNSVIPDFIRLAEIRLQRELRIRQMMKSATSLLVANDPRIAVPADFLEIRDLILQGSPRTPLTYMSPSAFSRDARADDVGRPVFYTTLAAEFQFAPVADQNYTIEILYYAKPDFLGPSVSSNVFLANVPDLLLYGSLGEAEPYLINDERLRTWSALYDRGLAGANDSSDRAVYSGVPIAMKLTTR